MMALQYEKNTDLAFDTTVMRNYGAKYADIADTLREMAESLDTTLAILASEGWTTPAGSAFHKMTETNWKENIEKYANLLDTLKTIIDTSCNQYEQLVSNHIEKTKV
ncbi:MAG: WXG100 family type VII secretion target [Eubacterium sp.]|nr:WXG100 family type VII secretion target [Eubacterium sp.]